MANKSNSSAKSRTTNSSSNPNRSSNRPNPNVSKAGVTRSGRRSYSNGGKIK